MLTETSIATLLKILLKTIATISKLTNSRVVFEFEDQEL